MNEPDPNHAGRQALLEVPTVPALDAETVAAEDRLFDAVEPVLDAWMLARDNVVEELERRAGKTMFPPGGLDRALEALSRLARAELAARTELARLLVELGHGDGGTRQGGANRGAPFPAAPRGTPDRAGSALRAWGPAHKNHS